MNPNQFPIVTYEKPTDAMIEFFLNRTQLHIKRVAHCIHSVAHFLPFSDELHERAATHDASKFEPPERLPYIWLTEFHRCRQHAIPFEYPAGVRELVKDAIRHHVTRNRHHPEFHRNPNEMLDIDLIEMVCDWTAMSQELGQHGGSARGWAEKVIGTQHSFDAKRKARIMEIIAMVDEANRTKDD
jgi:hypothetical protein